MDALRAGQLAITRIKISYFWISSTLTRYKLDQHVPPACSREINLEVQLGGDSFLHV